MMKQVASKMKLNPGCEAEYKKRHDEIWPELSRILTDAGVFDYSIFLDEETLTLFAVWKLAEENSAADLSSHPVVQKWWTFMAELMETHPDDSPVCVPLPTVFDME